MQRSFMIVDNFFDRPEAAREMALGLDYPDPG